MTTWISFKYMCDVPSVAVTAYHQFDGSVCHCRDVKIVMKERSFNL